MHQKPVLAVNDTDSKVVAAEQNDKLQWLCLAKQNSSSHVYSIGHRQHSYVFDSKQTKM